MGATIESTIWLKFNLKSMDLFVGNEKQKKQEEKQQNSSGMFLTPGVSKRYPF